MKEETLKGKLAKEMEKKELVKKYDDYVEQESLGALNPQVKTQKIW